MKALFAVDVHGSRPALDWVRRRGGDFDVLLVGGDLVRRGEEGFGREFLEATSACPLVYFVPGNADAPSSPVPEGVVQLHGKRTELGGLTVGGLGGSSKTPFGTPFELEDDSARSILSEVGKVDVLISHCPPSGTRCDSVLGRHIGSDPVREYVLREKPKLVLSGHVHEARGVDRLGETELVNAGPMMRGNYAVVELGRTISVELKNENM